MARSVSDRHSASNESSFERHLVSSLMKVLVGLDLPVLPSEDSHPGRHPGEPKLRSSKGQSAGLVGVYKNSRCFYKGAGKQTLLFDRKEARKRIEAKAVERFRQAIRHAVSEANAPYAPYADPAIWHIATVVSRSLPEARRQASEATIEKMVGALVETQDPVAQVSAEIDAANAKARVRFMANFRTLTAEEVNEESGSTARNRHQTASRWKTSGKIFSIPWQGLERYPAFQFKDGRPMPVVAEALAALPGGMSPWEIAFWFVSTNSWLGGASPQERLAEREGVVEAARLEGEAIAG